MGDILKIIALLPKILPLIQALILVAEKIGGDGTGAQKLQFVLDTVLGLLVSFGVIASDSADSARKVLSAIVNGIVGFLNARGWPKDAAA